MKMAKLKKMLKTLLAVLIIELIFFFICFMIYRIVGKRDQMNPLWLTGIFLGFFLFKKFIILFLRSCIEINRFFKKNPEEGESKIKNKLEKIGKKIENFFFYDVLQYGYRYYSYSLFSLTCYRFYEIILTVHPKAKRLFLLSLLIPWLIFIFFFLKDILLHETLHYSLYWFSANLLLWRLLKLGMVFAEYECARLKKRVLFPNFQYFYGEENQENFFIANPLIKNHFLFQVPLLKTKKSIKRLWLVFTEIEYFSRTKQLLDFLKEDLRVFLEFIYKINTIFFSTCFILIFLNQTLILYDLFIVCVIFVNFFLLLWFWIDFLIVSQPVVEKNKFLLNTQELLNEFFENCFLLLKKELLLNYKFLRKYNLPYPYIQKKTIIKLDIDRDEPFVDKFSKDEREFLDAICYEIYFGWFLPNILNGKINLDTLSFNPEK